MKGETELGRVWKTLCHGSKEAGEKYITDYTGSPLRFQKGEETEHNASAIAISANCSITGTHDQHLEGFFVF